jgi:His-Xaa-Ser system radical SAM maturase HxsC
MLLRTKGKPINIKTNLVGKVTRNPYQLNENTFLLLDGSISEFPKENFIGFLSTQVEYILQKDEMVVFNIPTLEHLSEGDIVSVGDDGNIRTLYRVNSFQNSLLATERCNSNCLMCSQPPKDKDDIPRLYSTYQKLIPLIPKDCIELGISGGEPTLMGNLFFQLLEQIKEELPNTEVHVLTNGRTFAWNHTAEKLGELNYQRLMLGIPVYSDYYQIHDYIVQSENAFYQTILGLHNLARYNQRLEIRVVLHKLSYSRLPKLAKYIFKNLPFLST